MNHKKYITSWYDLPDMVNISVENECSISASIKPSLGVRGQEILEGGGERREDRERGSHCLSFMLLTSPFHPEMSDTRADVQRINHKLVIQIMAQSVKIGTQTPREEKIHSQKSLSCQRYQMRHCLESVL